MNLKALLLLVTTLVGTHLSAQTTFQRTFGYSGDENIGTMLINSNGQITTAGKMRGMFASDFDAFVTTSSDPTGAMPVFEKYGAGVGQTAHDIEQTTDGGYVIASKVNSAFGMANAITKLDASLNVSWSKQVGQGSNEAWASVAETNDGGYVLVGSHDPDTVSSTKALLLAKFDANGNEQWVKTFSHIGAMEFHDVLGTADGGVLAVGYAQGFFTWGNYDLALVKLDLNGDSLWTRVLSTPINNYGNHVMEASGGGYLVAGGASGDCMLMKLDPNGLPSWTKSYGTLSNNEEFFDVIELSDGYLACGSMMQLGTSQDAVLIKTDFAGDTLWTRRYGEGFEDQGLQVVQHNGGYLIAGNRLSLMGTVDAWLIGTDANGWSGCLEGFAGDVSVNSLTAQIDAGFVETMGPASATIMQTRTTEPTPDDNVDCSSVFIQEYEQVLEVSVFPNPASLSVTLEIPWEEVNGPIEVIDMNGNHWKVPAQARNGRPELNVSELAVGQYVLKLTDRSGRLQSARISVSR